MLLLLSYRNPSTFRFCYSITQVVVVVFVQLLYCRGIYGTVECVPYHSGWDGGITRWVEQYSPLESQLQWKKRNGSYFAS
jgi:hypothetical protein